MVDVSWFAFCILFIVFLFCFVLLLCKFSIVHFLLLLPVLVAFPSFLNNHDFHLSLVLFTSEYISLCLFPVICRLILLVGPSFGLSLHCAPLVIMVCHQILLLRLLLPFLIKAFFLFHSAFVLVFCSWILFCDLYTQ